MRAAFLVDAGPEIGYGHLARSFVLARALAARRVGAVLYVRELPAGAEWRSRVVEAGLGLVELPRGLYTDPASRHELVARVLAEAPTHAVVDHYGVPAPTLAALLARGLDVTRLEDHGRASWAGERVLCPVPATEPPRDGAPAGLFGPRYALVDPAYRAARARRTPRSAVGRVLVSCGGADPVDLTRTAVQGVLDSAYIGAVDVVLGPAYAGRAAFLASPLARDPRVTIHDAPRGLVELLLSADVAVGAPGHTSWERACLGVASLLALQADNQTELAAFLAAEGAAEVLGWAGEVTPEVVGAALMALVHDADAVRRASARAAALVDGFGAERVADTLQGVLVRRATMADAAQLFEWANEPAARALSLNPAPIPWEDHVRWLTGVLGSPRRTLLVGEVAGRPLGQCRLDRSDEGAVVSVSLDRAQRGRGLARPFLAAALREHARDSRLVALVKPANAASLALFRGLGFGDTGATAEGVLRLECARFVG